MLWEHTRRLRMSKLGNEKEAVVKMNRQGGMDGAAVNPGEYEFSLSATQYAAKLDEENSW